MCDNFVEQHACSSPNTSGCWSCQILTDLGPISGTSAEDRTDRWEGRCLSTWRSESTWWLQTGSVCFVFSVFSGYVNPGDPRCLCQPNAFKRQLAYRLLWRLHHSAGGWVQKSQHPPIQCCQFPIIFRSVFEFYWQGCIFHCYFSYDHLLCTMCCTLRAQACAEHCSCRTTSSTMAEPSLALQLLPVVLATCIFSLVIVPLVALLFEICFSKEKIDEGTASDSDPISPVSIASSPWELFSDCNSPYRSPSRQSTWEPEPETA